MAIDTHTDPLTINPELVTAILTRFIRTEIRRAGFERAVMGLSGGIDSSVVTFLAARALGPENVMAVTMPYKTSSEATTRDALAVIDCLGVRTIEVPITGQIDAYFAQFPDASRLRLANKCARERMTVLYDQSAAFNALVLGTSNKSELLLGYGTQFGDMASAINPVGDLYKTQLYCLAAHLGVPRDILAKTPTGDLWVGQTDEGELGFTYAEADRLMVLMVDRRWRRAELIEAGFAAEFVEPGGDVDSPQSLQAPHAGHREALAANHGPRFPLRPGLGNLAEGNPNVKIRNKFQSRNPKAPNRRFGFSCLSILDLFRISDLGFRIFAYLPADQLLQCIHHLLLRQAVGEHFHGVFRPQQGTDLAAGVFTIAPLLGGKDLGQRCPFAARFQVAQPPTGTFLRARGEEDLAAGMWKYDRSLVAAFRDEVLPCRQGLLQEHEARPHLRMIGGVTRNRRDFPAPHGIGHVLALQEDPLAGDAKIQRQGQFGQFLRAVPINAGPQAGQGHGTVHGAGVQIAAAQSPGQGPSDGALSCPGGSVDGDNHGLHCARKDGLRQLAPAAPPCQGLCGV